MREIDVLHKQTSNSFTQPKNNNLLILSKTSDWQQFLNEALALTEKALKLGVVTIAFNKNENQRQSFVQANQLLTNALEHTEQPWLILEVLALVNYYLGKPLKAKELAFNSLNKYEVAVQLAKNNQTLLPTALKGYAFLTLGFILKQQGFYPLALQWFSKVPKWQEFSILLRLDGLWQVEACASKLKAFSKQAKNKTAIKMPNKVILQTNKWHQLTQYFSVFEQVKTVAYCLQAFNVGFALVSQSTKKAEKHCVIGASSTGNFTVPQACLLEAKHCFSKGDTHWKQGVRILKRSLRNTPCEPLIWYELGLFYVQANHKTRAVEAFQHCVALLPSCSKAQLELGHLHHDLGAYLASAEAYVWAISTTTDVTIKRQAAYACSVILERHAEKPSIQAGLNSLSVVLALLLKQEQEVPFTTSGTPSHLAKLCQQLGWSQLSYWFCVKSSAVIACPQQPQCSVNLAYMAAENGFLQEAVYYYKQSILENETDSSLHNSLGELYFKELLLIEPAKKAFELAISLDPTSATAQFNLGQIYGVQQQWTMAAQAFTKAKALNHTSQELDVAELDVRLHQLYENL